MSVFKLPDLGEGLEEAEIVTWHVAEGDRVVADQPLVSVETAKAVVEVPSPQRGTVARLLAAEGDTVHVGDPLVEFAGEGRADSGTVVGDLGETPAKAEPERPARPAPAPAAAGRVRAAPAVRALARELGVALEDVAGHGPGGAITTDDVRRAAEGEAEAGGEALSGVRRAMAENMERAGAAVVPATVTDDADVDHLDETADVTALLIRAMAAGVREVPAINARYDGRTRRRTLVETMDLGLAVDSPDGLFVPVIRDAGALDPAALRARIDALEAGVRDRSLPAADLRGASITLSNFGTLGGRYAALVVVPPQVAILGAGRAVRRAAVAGERVVARRELPLSLTFDHRAVTGGEAARFLAVVRREMERREG